MTVTLAMGLGPASKVMALDATLEALTMFGVGSSKLVGKDPDADAGQEEKEILPGSG